MSIAVELKLWPGIIWKLVEKCILRPQSRFKKQNKTKENKKKTTELLYSDLSCPGNSYKTIIEKYWLMHLYCIGKEKY